MSRKKANKRISLLLILCLVFTQIPGIAFATVDSDTRQQPSKSNAVIAESTETVTVFNLGNGYMHKTYHSEAVRYKDDDGKLTDYNPALVSVKDDKSENGKSLSDYRWVNKQGDSRQYFPAELDCNSPVLMEKDGYAIEMSLLTEAAFEAPQLQKEKRETPYYDKTESNVTASYASGNGSQKVEYTSENHGIKESIVLTEKPENNVFSYALKLNGLTAEFAKNRVLLKDSESKKVKAVIDAPFMYDASEDGAYSTDITYTLTKDTAKKNSWILTMTVSEAYLEAEERVYPVTVDPSVTWEGNDIIDAVYVDANDPNTGTEDSYYYYAGEDIKTYLSFPDIAASLSDMTITDATLHLTESFDSTGGEVTVKRVTSSWDLSDISWNDQPSVAETPLDSFETDGYEGTLYEADVTSLFQGYVNGTFEDYGIVLDGSGYTSFYGTSGRNNLCPAYFGITYQQDIPSPPSAPSSVSASDGSGTSASYFKKDRHIYANWSGITSQILDKVQYKITAADSSTPAPTEIGSGEVNMTVFQDFNIMGASRSKVIIPHSDELPDGKYTLHIRGVDTEGQTGSAGSCTFTVDGIMPTLTDVSVADGEGKGTLEEPSTETMPEISWNASDKNFSKVNVRINNLSAGSTTVSGYESLTPPRNKITRTGSHVIQVEAVDKAANRTSEQINYIVDLDNPVITSLTLTPETTASAPSANRSPVVSWDAQEPFFDLLEYKVGNGAYVALADTNSGSAALSESLFAGGDGTYTITFRVTDKAGHYATETRTYYLSGSVTGSYAPNNLAVSESYGKPVVTWELDLFDSAKKQYNLHRGSSVSFTPSDSTLIAEDVDMTALYYADNKVLSSGTCWYKFVVKDKNGGEDIVSSAVSVTGSITSADFDKRTGFKDYLSYYTFGTPTGSGYIEKSSGNLLYEQTDYSISNAQLDYGLDRTYNSMNEMTSMFGKGWTDSYHKELYLEGNEVHFVDSDGSILTFAYANGKYSCAERRGWNLQKTSGIFTLEDDSQNIYTFNKYGQLIMTEEPNGCKIINTYDRMGRLKSVTSEESFNKKALQFNYSGNGRTVASITDFAGTQYAYTYSSAGLLTKLQVSRGNEGSVDYEYGYNSDGLLHEVIDGMNNEYSISYTAGKAKNVTYPNDEYYELTYDTTNHKTTVTKHSGISGHSALYSESMKYDQTTGKMTESTDVNGVTTTYTYDSTNSGNPYLVVKEETKQYYQQIGTDNVIDMDCSVNLVVNYSYDEQDNLTEETSSTGEKSEYTYEDNLLIEEEHISSEGEVTEKISYDYEEAGNVIRGNLVTVTNHVNGTVTETEYDEVGREDFVTETENNVVVSETDNSYGAALNDASIFEENERTETITGDVVFSSDSTYDEMGRLLTQETDEETLTNTYDFLGRVVRTERTLPNGIVLTTTTEYNANGSIVKETSEKGVVTDYTYDSLNRVLSTQTSGSGIATSTETTEYGYAQNVAVALSTSGQAETIPLAYMETQKDSNGNVISKSYTDPSGNVVREETGTAYTCYDYDLSGNCVVSYTGGSGDTVLTLHDSEGRESATISKPGISGGAFRIANDSITTYTDYDDYGNAAYVTDGKGITTETIYDSEGRLTMQRQKNASGQVKAGITAAYEDYSTSADGKTTEMTTVTDANGNLKKEITDAAGQTVKIIDANANGTLSMAKEYTYNEKGSLVSEKYDDGSFILYSYDNLNRLTEKKAYDSTGAEESVISYTYNNYGEMLTAKTVRRGTTVSSYSWTYDRLGRVTAESVAYSGGTAVTTAYGYDSEGRLSSVTYPSESGLGTVTYSYDNFGNLTSVKKGGQTAEEYSYDTAYRISSVKQYLTPGGSSYILQTNGYGDHGRLDSIAYTKDGTTNLLESYDYEYDKNGNITERTRVNNLPETDTDKINETRNYTYSEFYDMLTATEIREDGVLADTISYGYDNVGNRTSMTENGKTTTYSYNGLNQLVSKTESGKTTNYSYDARGNQILEDGPSKDTAFSYFVTGELEQVKSGSTVLQTNTYNHEGIRISKKEGNSTRHYYYDNGQVSYTKDGSSISSANLLSPYSGISSTRRGNSNYTYLKDIQGSTGSLTDVNGAAEAVYSYSDFGEVGTVITPDIDNEFCYTGAVYDDTTGLHYLNARYYDPENGRFISQDSYRGELDDAVQWHLYAYCANNPINYIDPSGHKQYNITKKINSTMKENAKWFYDFAKKTKEENLYYGGPKRGWLLSQAGKAKIIAKFVSKVKSGGDWDLKAKKKWKPSTYDAKSFKYTFNETKYTMYAQDIGNMHFGYVGAVVFSKTTLCVGAGMYQVISKTSEWRFISSYFDDPRDTKHIQLGYDVWKEKYGKWVFKW